MDKHYVLTLETQWAGPTVVQLDDESRHMLTGKVTNPPKIFPKYLLRIEKGFDYKEVPPCDLQRAGNGQLLMSPKLLQTLNKAGVNNFQLFDCEVVYEPTKEKFEYTLVNIIGRVEALDREKSDCEIDEEDNFVDSFLTLRLDEKKLIDIHFARLFEAGPLIIISERIKSALEEAKITGIRIMEDHEWEPGIL